MSLNCSWSVVILDVAAAIGTRLPPCLDLGAIKTPLPRPWQDYENVSRVFRHVLRPPSPSLDLNQRTVCFPIWIAHLRSLPARPICALPVTHLANSILGLTSQKLWYCSGTPQLHIRPNSLPMA